MIARETCGHPVHGRWTFRFQDDLKLMVEEINRRLSGVRDRHGELVSWADGIRENGGWSQAGHARVHANLYHAVGKFLAAIGNERWGRAPSLAGRNLSRGPHLTPRNRGVIAHEDGLTLTVEEINESFRLSVLSIAPRDDCFVSVKAALDAFLYVHGYKKDTKFGLRSDDGFVSVDAEYIEDKLDQIDALQVRIVGLELVNANQARTIAVLSPYRPAPHVGDPF